jgi:hypothetical protein
VTAVNTVSHRGAFVLASILVCGAAGGCDDAHDGTDAAATPTADAPPPADALTSDAGTCDIANYPIDYVATEAEIDTVDAAVAAFQTAHPGVTVTLAGDSHAVDRIQGEVPIELDTSITDPCARAFAALDTFMTDNAALLRAPTGLHQKSCFYDDVTNSEILRLDGGLYYGDRPLLGGSTGFLVHVRRDGVIRYWDSHYVAVLDRPAAAPCLNDDGIGQAATDETLTYNRYETCVPKGPGQVSLSATDDYTVLGRGVFLDSNGGLHFVRAVDAFLAPGHVTPETANSDLFCCADVGVSMCVGKTLLIDELTGIAVDQLPRCTTC